ncbi:uncharacterized protein LOC122517681 [Polistes fuscatus]|uniref:uncharacterized protein LOC122517681 n=1 Tax=Polistes fuscatus TaxID=30207 RepID=UPI001CA8470D|nr:uncharacterized protein LOC122517681 [Polistes fuscatus]
MKSIYKLFVLCLTLAVLVILLNLTTNLKNKIYDEHNKEKLSYSTPKKKINIHATREVTICVVVCGDRLDESLTMLKSALVFTNTSLQFIVITENNLIPAFNEKLSEWKLISNKTFDFVIRSVTFPEGNNPGIWKKLFKPCAAQRLFLPTVLNNTDAVLYMDTDTLFLAPPEKIWDEFKKMNSSQLAALSPEHEDPNTGWYNRFAKHPYYGKLGVNSGVMLMNLTRMREFRWTNYVVPIHKEYKLKITWGDQDIINIIFHYHPEKLYVYPCRFNYRPDHCMYMSVCTEAEKHGALVLHGSRELSMPLFKVRSPSTRSPMSEKKINGMHQHRQRNQQSSDNDHEEAGMNGTNNKEGNNPHQLQEHRSQRVSQSSLVFHCQLAHGSPTGLISGFSNVRELYQKIAECYDIPVEEILFCTLNTHKVEMSELLGSQIGVGDFIFAHRKGRPKEIELMKTDDALGLTITDNGAGYAFIKRIKEGSVIDKIKVIEVGDHIEKIDSMSLIGKRHFDVAKILKDIPKGTTFTLRLIEPQKNGFGNIGPRGDLKKGKKSGYGSGKETLRFKADGSAQIIENVIDDIATIAVGKINTILENFMGIYDTELATRIWELAEGKFNSIDFAEAIDNSELEDFGFTEDFVIELWGAITDARAGRHR